MEDIQPVITKQIRSHTVVVWSDRSLSIDGVHLNNSDARMLRKFLGKGPTKKALGVAPTEKIPLSMDVYSNPIEHTIEVDMPNGSKLDVQRKGEDVTVAFYARGSQEGPSQVLKFPGDRAKKTTIDNIIA
jgi:hypothetical protein